VAASVTQKHEGLITDRISEKYNLQQQKRARTPTGPVARLELFFARESARTVPKSASFVTVAMSSSGPGFLVSSTF
jgi:hypothetical protein